MTTQGERGPEPETGSNSPSVADAEKTPVAQQKNLEAQPPADQPVDTSGEDTGQINPGDPLYEIIHGSLGSQGSQGSEKGTAKIPGAGRMPQNPLSRAAGMPIEDRKAAYKRWLEERSKDELIEMIVGLESRENSGEHTEKVTSRLRPEDAVPPPSAEAYRVPDDLTFIRLPVVRKSDVNQPTPTWQIVLVPLEQNSRAIGLQIDSEISIGRTAGDATPDLDLTPYGAKTKGVSRIHARLRPEMFNLLLFDNDSSNGTFWNRIRLPAQADRLLRDGDVLTFGRLTFLLKIVKAPNTTDTKTLL